MTRDRDFAAARGDRALWRQVRIPPSGTMRWTLVAVGLVVAVAATLIVPPKPLLIWNVTASAPLGLYRVERHAPLGIGDMVAARVPARWRHFAGARRYVPVNVPLIKRIAAIGGDRICSVGTRIFVNGEAVAERRRRDGAGRSMPSWSGCLVLRDTEFLLLMPGAASFDGRYFGPTRSADLLGRAELIWKR